MAEDRGVADDSGGPLLPIGELAQRTRLTVRALRIYDRTGLLRPVMIDPGNGYRRYDPGQVRTGQLIGLLRGAGLSLPEIRLVLADLAVDGDLAARRLELLLAGIERRHADRVLLIRHVQATL